MGKGFSYKIDYDAALAQDASDIEWYQALIDAGAHCSCEGERCRCGAAHMSPIGWFVRNKPEALRALGLGQREIELYFEFYDLHVMHREADTNHSEGMDYNELREHHQAVYDFGERIFTVRSLDGLKYQLKRAKAAKSRHRRNRARYG